MVTVTRLKLKMLSMMPEFCFVSHCCGSTGHRIPFNDDGYWWVCDNCHHNCEMRASYHHKVYQALNHPKWIDGLLNVFLEFLRIDYQVSRENLEILHDYLQCKIIENYNILTCYNEIMRYCWKCNVKCPEFIEAYKNLVTVQVNIGLKSVREDMMKTWKVYE